MGKSCKIRRRRLERLVGLDAGPERGLHGLGYGGDAAAAAAPFLQVCVHKG